jgi:hypothetical protein
MGLIGQNANIDDILYNMLMIDEGELADAWHRLGGKGVAPATHEGAMVFRKDLKGTFGSN